MSDDRLESRDIGMSRRGVLGLTGFAVLGADAVTTILGVPKAEAASADLAELPWPGRGCFASKCVVGPHQPSAAALFNPAPQLGIPREASFFYGCVRDDAGNMMEIVRTLPDRPNNYPGLFVQSNGGMDTLHAVPQVMMAAAPSTGHVCLLENGSVVWRNAPDAKGKPFEININEDGSQASWKEEGSIDLTGTLLGPGLQWHLPDPAGSELYVSQIYEMQGVVLGKKVRGILAFDQSYLQPDQPMYSGKDPLFRPKEHHRCWYTWGTRYKDGSYDAGHFVLGTDRMGFALLTNESKHLVLNTDVSGEVTIIPQGMWPQHIVIDVAGVQWEFLPEPRGRMPDMAGGKAQSVTPQNEGRWRRVGDTREPDIWFAWGEIAPVGRTTYSRIYRY